MKTIISIILTTVLFVNCSTKVLLFTYAFNRPDFIEIQYKTFKKFLKDDYDLIVINDANEPELAKSIADMCNVYNITCINVPQEIHERPYLNRPEKGPYFITHPQSPCSRNCNVVQYSLDTIGFKHSDIVALFDSDLFLVKDFSITHFLENFDAAGFDRSQEYSDLRNTKQFLWIGLIFLNIGKMPFKTAFNVNCGIIDKIGLDSGGYTNFYLPHVNTRYFDRIRIDPFICKECTKQKSYRCKHNTKILLQHNFSLNDITLIQETPIDWGSGSKELGMHLGRNLEFFLNNIFVHYRGASNYAPLSAHGIDMELFHRDKTEAFEKYLECILEE